MIPRKISCVLESAFQRFPILCLTGPRQSGKTTLVKKLFNYFPYVSLEDPDVRQFAEEDPRGFLQKYNEGAIFDEIQRVPKLLSYLQTVVDNKGSNSQYVLTGSQQFELLQNITQSLAGRVILFKLLPLSLEELYNYNNEYKNLSTDDFLLKGFYPRNYAPNSISSEVYNAYYETYVERDVRSIIKIKDLSLFRKFMQLCAGRVGQILNREKLSQSLGINVKTVEEWLGILEASYIIYRLTPLHMNINRRLTKSPKLYFYDTGLLCNLLRLENEKQISVHPLRGEIFENFILMEILKHRLNNGKNDNMFFYRDSNSNEVDIILEYSDYLIAMEIKSSQTFHNDFLKGLKSLETVKKCERFVCMGGGESFTKLETTIFPWQNIVDIIDDF